MSKDFYRFRRTQVESISAFKGTNSWYSILSAQNEPLYACHGVGSCLGGTTTFHTSREDERVLFRLEPKRKFLNLTYFVCEAERGPAVATLELFKMRGMKATGPHGTEIFRVIDPKGRLDKIVQDVLEAACSDYALVADDETIGRFGRREPPVPEQSPRKGILGRLLRGLAMVLGRDWCLELEDEGKVIEDHRTLLAGMIVLLEQSIFHDQTT